jgi:hypothetical protein
MKSNISLLCSHVDGKVEFSEELQKAGSPGSPNGRLGFPEGQQWISGLGF